VTTSTNPDINHAPHAQMWSGQQLATAIATASEWLDAHRDQVNALNVFPVPDGDTGTNMAMTMKAAVGALPSDDAPVSDVVRQLAYGALMGARGNSGVILSQIFRGFAAGLSDRDELDGRDFASALRGAQEMAYKAVMRPVEGTMLTVIRGAADRAAQAASRSSSLEVVLAEAIDGARAALESTPQLLEILRQAGVVDAGGQGIVLILEGMQRYNRGDTSAPAIATDEAGVGADMAFLDDMHGEDDFGYCTNFMVMGASFDFERSRAEIAAMGQSAVIVGDDTMLKVHIHTENPGEVLAYAIRLGSLDQIKIDNMSLQTETLTGQRSAALATAPPVISANDMHGDIAVVAVAAGEGISEALRAMGATSIVAGGQTMNPSTEDLLNAVEDAPFDQVIILPNNKNIFLTANQVPALTTRTVRVLPTISISQALTALASFNPGEPIDDNIERMTEVLADVRSLELTRAVRDVELDGITIANGQIIGLLDDSLVAAGDDLATVAADLLTGAGAEEAELVTVFSGADASDQDIDVLREVIASMCPDAEAEFQPGGQPHYLFVISVE
jgi:DAK2 domain fusion protein YloV